MALYRAAEGPHEVASAALREKRPRPARVRRHLEAERLPGGTSPGVPCARAGPAQAGLRR